MLRLTWMQDEWTYLESNGSAFNWSEERVKRENAVWNMGGKQLHTWPLTLSGSIATSGCLASAANPLCKSLMIGSNRSLKVCKERNEVNISDLRSNVLASLIVTSKHSSSAAHRPIRQVLSSKEGWMHLSTLAPVEVYVPNSFSYSWNYILIWMSYNNKVKRSEGMDQVN